ncbi:hypothetical protein V2J09_003213 [Rumex salicifolius]
MAVFSKIGILGGGISGITAAKHLSKHNPVVFEASDSIGGVWKHASFSSTKLQTPRCDYEFSDFPWPDRDNESFPSNVEILDYLHAYASHFDVIKFVRLNTKVVELRYVGDQVESESSVGDTDYGRMLAGKPAWEVAVQTKGSDEIQWYAFEMVVVCMGKYGDIPHIPKFPLNKGPNVFKGQVLHTLDYCKLNNEQSKELFKGKKVVVVGYKKSAIDLAFECAQFNQGDEGKACKMIVRTPHWIVPHYWIWGLPFYLFFSTRSSQFIHQRPNQSVLRALSCLLFSPMASRFKKFVSKVIESYLLHKLPLEKYGIKPDHPFLEDYASCQMAIVPEGFFSMADQGLIEFQRASEWSFCEEGIELEDGTLVEADVVVLATGYDGKKKLTNVLPREFHTFLEYVHGLSPLHRCVINPMIRNMAFVGYIETVSNLQASELRCKWLSRLVDDKFELPTVHKMLEIVAEEAEVMKKTTRFYKRHCVSTFSINHNDELCEEMGWSSWRKNTWLSEAFSPYTSQDYAEK